MKYRPLVITSGLTLVMLLLSACAGLTPRVPILLTPTIAPLATSAATSPTASFEDSAGLIEALRAQGVSVEAAGNIDQPFFSVHGQSFKISGADVQVFEYIDAAAANQEAALVSRDGGSVGTTMVSWMAAPHFYKVGKVIVLYLGSDAAIISPLQKVLGPQFAGA